MSPSEVFEMVRNGSLTAEEFAEWLSEQRHEAYLDGVGDANFQNATSYLG